MCRRAYPVNSIADPGPCHETRTGLAGQPSNKCGRRADMGVLRDVNELVSEKALPFRSLGRPLAGREGNVSPDCEGVGLQGARRVEGRVGRMHSHVVEVESQTRLESGAERRIEWIAGAETTDEMLCVLVHACRYFRRIVPFAPDGQRFCFRALVAGS